jgi:ornithine cyclodeaminase/alanine dehydrogenase-like protein (mu-crystallin family)
VARALDPDALLEALASAFADVSQGRASVPARIAAFAPAGLLGAMVAYVPSLGVLAAKLVSVFAKNQTLPTHQAVVVAFDPESGTPLAIMDGTEITAQRTAAASALATKLLARPDARVLAVVGTGVQALWHARHVRRVRPFQEVLIAGRDPGRAAALAREVAPARAVSIDYAVHAADVICATTHSKEPLVHARLVRPGTHVCSVGLNDGGSEIDPALFEGALLAVESRKAAFAPSPAGARELQGRDPAQAVELGELVARSRTGRTSPDQVTLYKSVGIAAEDAAAASLVLR